MKLKKELANELKELRRRLNSVESMISNREESEKDLPLDIDINRVVAELSYSLITSNASLAGLADIVLNYAKVFTNSEYGYVSSIDPVTRDNLCHTLTGMIGDSCKISENDKGIVFPIGKDGKYPTLWGHCLNTRKGFFTNTPQSHAASIGTPDHHIPVHSFLSVPAIIGKELFGQCGDGPCRIQA